MPIASGKRRNPGRGARHKAVLEIDNGNPSEELQDTDPAESDEEMYDVDNPANGDPSSSDELEEEPPRERSRRRQKQRTLFTTRSAAPTSSRPSRSTRFSGSMKEAPSDSVRDLFQGTDVSATFNSAKRAKKSARAIQDSEDSDAGPGESSDEEPITELVSRKARQKNKSSPAKSPARRHSHARKSVKPANEDIETASSDEMDEVYDGDDDEEQPGQDNGDVKIQRVLATRTETRDTWKKICSKMNSSEVTDGSRWFQSDVGDQDGDAMEERFLIKWSGLSYMHCSWETQEDLSSQVDGAKTYLSTFFRKAINGILFSQDDRKDGDYFDPGCAQIDRILESFYEGKSPTNWQQELDSKNRDFAIVLDKNDERFEEGTGRQFLVKWQALNYSECTWEFERDLILADTEYKEALKELYQRTRKPTKSEWRSKSSNSDQAMRQAYKIFGDNFQVTKEIREHQVSVYQKELADHVWQNGGQLRDYQAEGVSWFLSNYVNQRSCILADEMGLGKTLQTAAFISILVNKMHRNGPFLIVVPLSTLAHWQREFISWTGINTIVYHGSAEDRTQIRESEFAYSQDRPASVGANALYLNKCAAHRSGGPWMAKVVVTTPETVTGDDWAELAAVQWEVLVVDEAHRLKNHTSKLATILRKEQFTFNHKVLLSGTPIQNDVKEFWTLLNFIDSRSFEKLDTFLEKYGDMKSKEHIDDLHETIRPYILRRLKEDVEKSVPPKEETLIEVELTLQQKQYYRALYEKNVKFLHKNKKKALDGPSLNNLAMQLRKCCNHLFLLNGVELEVRKLDESKGLSEADLLTKGSGKFVLLDKLLPRLKEKGHRVLLFSQFKIMLDVLEDYLTVRGMKFERIDGSITGHRRQASIDRFQDDTSSDPPFVMLLSTRAGGVGINLTSADTCIIFDSDWNPQNDLQAQARCHRIGQTKNVKVYRLLSRQTYEMQMFHMSSLKMGLDQAVLKGFESGTSGEGAMTKEEVEKLLRHGAYDIFNEDKAGSAEAASKDFIEQDIDSILERARTVVHENTGSKSNAAGGTFSKASFVAPTTPSDKTGQQQDVDIEDPDFWKKVIGDVQPEAQSELKPRQRTKTNYSERFYQQQLHRAISMDSEDSGGSSESSDSEASGGGGALHNVERAHWGGKGGNHWRRVHAEAVLKSLERYGYGILTWSQFKMTLPAVCKKFTEQEICRMAWSMVFLALSEVSADDALKASKRAESTAALKDRPYQDLAFQNLWRSHRSWGKASLEDAIAYATVNEARALTSTTQTTRTEEINKLFRSSLWPSLQGRGWKEESTDGKKMFVFGAYRFESPSTVLNEVVRIHPELHKLVLPILRNLENSRMAEQQRDEDDRREHLGLNASTIKATKLKSFVARYSPLQLINDRKSTKRLFLAKRLLHSCDHMYTAKRLIAHADSTSKELTEILYVDARLGLPHPLWTQQHDAVLIRAIAKHGWIDREKACRAMTEDATIKWGFPFDAVEPSKVVEISEEDMACLRGTAQRAVEFLDTNEDLIEALGRFNRHLLVESYGLKHSTQEDVSRKMKWEVDEEMLRKGSAQQLDSGTNEPLDLPVKKDMAKRAKLVLNKSLVALEAGTSGGSRKPSSDSNKPSSAANHGYTVIDQGNRSCILLAEIIRGVVRASYSKMAKQINLLCAYAYAEAEELSRMFAAKQSAESRKLKEEFEKIAEQIALAKRSMKSAALLGKNVLRVMLGLEPIQARNSTEPLFPSAQSLDNNVNPAQPGKKETTRRDEGALGDKALMRGLKKAYQKSNGAPNRFTSTDDSEVGLQLTMIEALILLTFTSEGLPLVGSKHEQGHAKSQTWEDWGSVLEIAAKDYHVLSKEKLEKSRASLKRLEGNANETSQADAAKKVASAEWEEAMVEEAAKQTIDYVSGKQISGLAKKSIMLLEKLRRTGFQSHQPSAKNSHKFENHIGAKVPAWLSKELGELALAYDIVDDSGKPMSYTTTDLLGANPQLSDTRVAAYLDKKACRQVFCQVALLARLSTVIAKNSEAEFRKKVIDSMEKSKRLGEVWEKKPAWWDEAPIDHTLLLLQRLNEKGFSNVLTDNSGFTQAHGEDATKSLKEMGLTKSIVQQRMNQLVRELHNSDEAEDTMRMLEERRSRGASKKQGYDKSLAECHTNKGGSKGKGIQTGLRAFFVSTKTGPKMGNVLSHNENSKEVAGKRKDSPLASEAVTTPEKKAKFST